MAEVPAGTTAKMPQSIILLKNNLALLLLAHSRSQAQFCRYLGVNQSWMSKLLRGRRNMVSMWYLDKIATYFEIEVYELFMPVRNQALVQHYFDARPNGRLKEVAPRAARGLGRRDHPIEIAAKAMSRQPAKR